MKFSRGLTVALLFSWMAFSATAFCQVGTYGLPGIRNYTRAEYQGGTQNWGIAQNADGMMYFANNHGLLEFDGSHWNLYSDLGRLTRSVCVDGDRIYVGAFNTFGYYSRNKNGMLEFTSLVPLIGKRITDFDEIWRIYKTSFGIVFQSFRAIFIYNNGKINIVYPRSQFHFSYYANGVLWIYDQQEGLMQYRDGKVRQVPGGNFFTGTEIWSLLPINDDQVLVGTAKNGLFRYDGQHVTPWNNKVNEMVKHYQLYSSCKIDNKYLAFGTIQNGLILCDTAGNLIYALNKDKGLGNNTILSCNSDAQGNIWLGLDNGISMIRINSPITYIQDYFNLGSGYTSLKSGNTLYLGTNQGLFSIDWEKFVSPYKTRDDFHLIAGTEGQVWCLAESKGKVLCGHNFGVFQITGNQAEKISDVPGGWNLVPCPGQPDLLLSGHYSGISVLAYSGGSWHYRNEVSGFNQSAHFVVFQTAQSVWVSHDYKGIYQLQLDAGYTRAVKQSFMTTQAGLPRVADNRVFGLGSSVAFATQNGAYTYRDTDSTFVPDPSLNKLLPGKGPLEYLFRDHWNNIWYYQNQRVGVLRVQEDGKMRSISIPFREIAGKLLPSYGHVNCLDANNALIGIEGGFAHYRSDFLRQTQYHPPLLVSRLFSGDTSEGIFRFSSLTRKQSLIPAFHFRSNTISISFATAQFAEAETPFRYRLKGFDPAWSQWAMVNFKEYTNLAEGEYEFLLQAMTPDGVPSEPLAYKFRILPPWYRSVYAYLVYVLIIALLMYSAYQFYLKSLEKSRAKEQQAQLTKYRQKELLLKEEALVTEKEMVNLRNEKLKLEVLHQEKELANSSMMIIQKNEILHKIRKDLLKLKNLTTDDALRVEVNTSIKKIGREIDNEKQWQVFNTHVEQVHDELFRKLKERFPELTPRELSLCAYLRMNISSKEIATLMNISTRGVEISRYRIRKKMNLDRNTNLTDFMLKL